MPAPGQGEIDRARREDVRSRLARLIELGTEGYPPDVRTRLKILNVVAYLIAAFTLVYAVQQMFADFRLLAPVIALNLAIVAVALLVPLAHRISDIAGALLITLTEYAALFLFMAYLGRTSGVHLQYFAAPAAFFVIFGLQRLRLILLLTALGVVLHIAAWFMFPRQDALIAVDERMLNSLYVTAVLTTVIMIGAVIYYAFRLAEQARAETETLLRNILPLSIVDRLKANPGAPSPTASRTLPCCSPTLRGSSAWPRPWAPSARWSCSTS